MLTYRDALAASGVLPGRSDSEESTGGFLQGAPGAAELRSMCHNAQVVASLCELLGVEGSPERDELELELPDGAFILPPE